MNSSLSGGVIYLGDDVNYLGWFDRSYLETCDLSLGGSPPEFLLWGTSPVIIKLRRNFEEQ